MDISQSRTLTHGYQPVGKEIIGGYLAGSQVLLVIFVNVEDCLAALGLLDAVTVAVIDKGAGSLSLSSWLDYYLSILKTTFSL